MSEQRPADPDAGLVRRDHLYLALIAGLFLGTGPTGLPIWAFAIVGVLCLVAAGAVRRTEPRREPSRLDNVVLLATAAGGTAGGTLGANVGGVFAGAVSGVVCAVVAVVLATAVARWFGNRRVDT